MTDTVVLLHGIRRTSASMRKFEKHLQTQGYITRNVDYLRPATPLNGWRRSLLRKSEMRLRATEKAVFT
jgi:hypothetical protein